MYAATQQGVSYYISAAIAVTASVACLIEQQQLMPLHTELVFSNVPT
jgi:hypothetical protein